ncbi:MAG: peptide ABC transporter substrate-binding protein [Clostridia bacterium]|nr:peptide ABC transporter substrate-binding protein [Clostridia bacterium]
MRNSWFKYIFILFAIGIIIFAVVKIKGDEENKKQEQLAKENRQEDRIKEITLGIAEFDSINPILSYNQNVQDISKLIFEPLINLSNTYKPEPALAKEWAKQDGTTYLIKLRENVKWSDGTDFTAEDVRYTIDRLKRDTPSIYGSNVQYVERVDAVDNTTLKITLSREVPFFEYYLTFPIMSSKFFGENDFANAEKNQKPIGTGKYKITEVQPSVITLEKNENWWNAKKIGLSLEKININLYSSVGELYNSFKTGSIDLLSTNNNNFSDYIGTIGYNLKETRGREHVFLALNTQGGSLQDVNVRKALASSIDKTSITNSIYGGKYYTASFPLEYGSYLYKGSTPSIAYNLENATNIMTEAGWELPYGTWQKYENYTTQRLTLNFVVKASNNTMVAVAENITGQLEAQGYRINLIRASDETYQVYKDNKDYDLILCSMQLPLSPDLSTFFGETNLANYVTEETNQIMNEVKNSTDEKVLKEKYERLEQIYNTEIPYISLVNSKYNVLYNSNLVGDVAPNWFSSIYNIEGWYKN